MKVFMLLDDIRVATSLRPSDVVEGEREHGGTDQKVLGVSFEASIVSQGALALATYGPTNDIWGQKRVKRGSKESQPKGLAAERSPLFDVKDNALK